MTNRESIQSGQVYLGIELGSTRIKAVLINSDYEPIGSGDYIWENQLVDGFWTYSLEEVWKGIQSAYKALKTDVLNNYNTPLKHIKSIGVSGMMHGYLPFNDKNDLLVPFRTWRNNLQGEASKKLTELFQYPVPQRWSIAHLYQAFLKGEKHLEDLDFMTTIAGYVHWQLTGEKVVGIGEASGMFPIVLMAKDYNQAMIDQFNNLVDLPNFDLKNILPKVLVAGEFAGKLSEKGKLLLDPTGDLDLEIIFCPPEGDAGTGMVATNTVKVNTGVVSAGTSIFGMIVLEKDLKQVHEAIDQVMTPSGNLVAMVHANNCTSDLNAWVGLFKDVMLMVNPQITDQEVYEILYKAALDGEPSCDGMLAYGYLSGEHITHFEEGRPLFVRNPESDLTISNFMRTHLYSALSVLKIGFDILSLEENVKLKQILAHGGLFKTEGVGQRFMAAALNTPVSLMATAGEGGPYGMALLAAYTTFSHELALDEFLTNEVFNKAELKTIAPLESDVEGFKHYLKRYQSGLSIEHSAVEMLIS